MGIHKITWSLECWRGGARPPGGWTGDPGQPSWSPHCHKDSEVGHSTRTIRLKLLILPRTGLSLLKSLTPRTARCPRTPAPPAPGRATARRSRATAGTGCSRRWRRGARRRGGRGEVGRKIQSTPCTCRRQRGGGSNGASPVPPASGRSVWKIDFGK